MKSSVTNRKQRFWALLLAVVMVVGLLPNVGTEAANYSLQDTGTGELFTVGKIISAEATSADTITNGNTNTNDKYEVKVAYQDVDGTLLKTDTILFGASASVKKYSECFTGSLSPKLSSEHVSDKWTVTGWVINDIGNSGSNYTTVTVRAIPKYTITLNKNGGTNFDVSSLTAANIVTNDANKIVIIVNDGDTIDLSKVVGEKRGFDFAKWIIPDGADPTGALMGAIFGRTPNPYKTIQFEQSTGFFQV